MARKAGRVKCACGTEVTVTAQFKHWLACGETLHVRNSGQDGRYGRRRAKAKRGGAPRGGKVFA